MLGIFGGETSYYSHLVNETSVAAVDDVVDKAKVSVKAMTVVGKRQQPVLDTWCILLGGHRHWGRML